MALSEAGPKRTVPHKGGLPVYRFFWHEEMALLEKEVAALQTISSSLDEAYRAMVERLARAVQVWDINLANAILQELGVHLNMWETIVSSAVAQAMEDAWDKGALQVSGTLKAGGIVSVMPFIPRDMLIVSQTTMPTLIKAISQQTLMDVARDLRVSALGQETAWQVLERLGGAPPRPGEIAATVPKNLETIPMYRPMPGQDIVKSGPFTGYAARKVGRGISAIGRFPTAFHRAEAILRTEMGRMSSIANQMTLEQVNRTNPGMQKQWSAILDARTRPEHVAAHGQLVDADDQFEVGGERLRYPRDERASPSNTVNCRCVALPWNPMWEKYGFGTDLQPPTPAEWVWEEEPRGSWMPPLTPPGRAR